MRVLALLLLIFVGCGSGGGDDENFEPIIPGNDANSNSVASSRDGLLLEENFDDGVIDPRWNDSYIRTEYYKNGQSPFVDVDGHGKALNYYIPKGELEITPVSIGAAGPEAFQNITGNDSVTEFYVEWDEYYPDGHLFPAAAQKLLRFSTYYPDQPNGCVVNLMLLNSNNDIQLSFIDPSQNPPIDVFVNTNIAAPTGQWITYGVWAKLNSPGKSNGFGRVYLNGNQIISLENVSIRGNDSREWTTMWVGGNFTNGVGIKASRAGNRYIDNVKWYSTKPKN